MSARPHALFLALLLLAAGCRTPEADPVYRPTESVLEVLAVLRLHVHDDTYRFPPARDFTGKNIYYASLRRLERLEEIHEDKFKSGYLLEPILYAKALALERLGEFELAARHYERAAEFPSDLREPAERGADICQRLLRARETGPTAETPPEMAADLFDERVALLERLFREVEDSHYRFVVQQEIERADRARAEHFAARANLDPRLDAYALQQYQQLVQSHPESKLRNRHLLDLADQYAQLSRRYVSRVPPTMLDFDPATFDEYALGATRLYEAVSQQDGAIEKIEASRKLEADLAFTLRVEDEKLPH